jgi:hypothetical protein
MADWLVALFSTLTAIAVALTGLIVAVAKLRAVARPLFGRRGLTVAVVAAEDHDDEVAGFIDELEAAGYAGVCRTRIAYAIAPDTRVAVLWRPAEDQAERTLAATRNTAPDAVVLVLSADRLPIRPADEVLISNSKIRLRGDLAAVAEVARG